MHFLIYSAKKKEWDTIKNIAEKDIKIGQQL